MTHIRLKANHFYHVYNRGVNSQNIFFAERNYAYFLKRYAHYLSPVVKTYAYCLLPNHFHLLVQARSQEELHRHFNALQAAKANRTAKPHEQGLHTPDQIISKQFASFFNSYTKSINKAYDRTGNLLERTFERKEVDSPDYFANLLFYIHRNPEKHGLITDFTEYPHSSYHSFIFQNATRLPRQEVLDWYGNRDAYIAFHRSNPDLSNIEHLIIEY